MASPNPEFFNDLANYLGVPPVQPGWPELCFDDSEQRDQRDRNSIPQHELLDRLHDYTARTEALRLALKTAHEVYSYLTIDGDRTVIGAIQGDKDTITIVTIGRNPDELLEYRREEILAALDDAHKYCEFAQELLRGHGRAVDMSAFDSLDAYVGTAVTMEPLDRTKVLLADCAAILSEGEGEYEHMMNFIQEYFETLSTDDRQINSFVPLYQDTRNAHARLFCIGNDIASDVGWLD